MKFNFRTKKPALANAKKSLAGALTLLLALALTFSLAIPALAVPLQPNDFFGKVYIENVLGCPPVAEGAVVTAEIGGVRYIAPEGDSYGTVDASGTYGYPFFAFNVPGDDPDTTEKEGGVDGDTVSFFVDGMWAIDATFISAAHTELDLPVTDNLPPTVTIDALSPECTKNNTPTFTGTATDNLCQIASVEYSIDGGAWTMAAAADGTFDSAVEDYTFTTAALTDGMHTVDVRATDAAANVTDAADYASDSFTIDTATPTGTVSINGGATCTCNTVATLTLTYDDGIGCGVTMMRFSNNNSAWSAWEAVADTKVWNLSSGEGLKTVYVEYLDAAGNNSVSGTITDTITLDMADPTGSIVINSGDACTNSDSVTLTLTWDDGAGCGVTQMRFSNDNSTWSDWEAVMATKAWVLAAGDGMKTVYVEYIDVGGNNSNSIGDISDDIHLDMTAPTGTVEINNGDAETADANVTLALTWDDGSGCGVTMMRFSNNNSAWSAWEAAGASKAWVLSAGDGVKTVYVEFIDAAENTSTAVISDDITLTSGPDVTAPIVFDVNPDADAINQPIDVMVWAMFDEDITVVDLSGVTISGATGVSAMLSGTDTIAISHDDFAPAMLYMVTIPAGAVEDLSGNPNAMYSWIFTTVDADVTAPIVIDTNPNIDAVSQAVNVPVWAMFNEDVTVIDLTGVTISGATGVMAMLDGTDTVAINHDDFAQATTYTVTIPAGAVEDLSGNPNAMYSWSFTTIETEVVYTLDLQPGWNLISTPIALSASMDTWGEFSTFGDGLDYDAAYYYNGSGFNWLTSSYAMQPCYAVYVHMLSADSVPIIPSGSISQPPSRMLNEGWSLIGPAFLDEFEKPISEALISLYYAPGENQPWGYSQVVSPNYNQPSWVYIRDGGTQNLLVGKGYWISMDNADEYQGQTWTPWEP